MRSISASTCAISSSALGESVKLVSPAPRASAPNVATTATGPSTTTVIKALIQRDLVIRTSIAPKRRRHGVQEYHPIQGRGVLRPGNRGAPAATKPSGKVTTIGPAHPNGGIDAVIRCRPLRTENG